MTQPAHIGTTSLRQIITGDMPGRTRSLPTAWAQAAVWHMVFAGLGYAFFALIFAGLATIIGWQTALVHGLTDIAVTPDRTAAALTMVALVCLVASHYWTRKELRHHLYGNRIAIFNLSGHDPVSMGSVRITGCMMLCGFVTALPTMLGWDGIWAHDHAHYFVFLALIIVMIVGEFYFCRGLRELRLQDTP